MNGICECGCGGATKLVDQTDRARGVVRGQPRRFIYQHNWRREPKASPYKQRYAPGITNGENGTIHDHVLIAMTAIGGRRLPKGAEVHHVDENPRNNARRNLVICESKGYHKLLHVRARILRAGGNPNTDKVCGRCGLVKRLDEFYVMRSNKATGRQNRCIPCVSEGKYGPKRAE